MQCTATTEKESNHLVCSALLQQKKNPIDMNFTNTNWKINQNSDKEENDAVNFIDRFNAQQMVHLSTCGKNTLDVVFVKNIGAETHIDNTFEEIYDLSDHKPESIGLSLNGMKNKPVYECF